MPQPYKKHAGSTESSLTFPWQHAVFLCVLLLMIGFVILPLFISSSIASDYMLPIFQTILGYSALFCGMLGLIKLANETFFSEAVEEKETTHHTAEQQTTAKEQSTIEAKTFVDQQAETPATINNVVNQ